MQAENKQKHFYLSIIIFICREVILGSGYGKQFSD